MPSHIRIFTEKLVDISKEYEVITDHEGESTSIRFTLQKQSINPRNFIKKKRIMSEKQLANLKRINQSK